MYAEVYMHIGGLILKVISKIRLDLYIKTILDVQARRCFLLNNGFSPKKLSMLSLGAPLASRTQPRGKASACITFRMAPPLPPPLLMHIEMTITETNANQRHMMDRSATVTDRTLIRPKPDRDWNSHHRTAMGGGGSLLLCQKEEMSRSPV